MMNVLSVVVISAASFIVPFAIFDTMFDDKTELILAQDAAILTGLIWVFIPMSLVIALIDHRYKVVRKAHTDTSS